MDQYTKLLAAGKLLLSPTDTIWGILCDATNPEAVERVYTLKKRPDSKAMVCMVSDLKMLQRYIEVLPENLHQHLEHPRPTTIIYPNPCGIAPNAVAKENTVAIRVVKHHFCTPLIAAFGKPLISTSANLSGDPHPQKFEDIDPEIVRGVDGIIDLKKEINKPLPSRIIKIDYGGKIDVIRA